MLTTVTGVDRSQLLRFPFSAVAATSTTADRRRRSATGCQRRKWGSTLVGFGLEESSHVFFNPFYPVPRISLYRSERRRRPSVSSPSVTPASGVVNDGSGPLKLERTLWWTRRALRRREEVWWSTAVVAVTTDRSSTTPWRPQEETIEGGGEDRGRLCAGGRRGSQWKAGVWRRSERGQQRKPRWAMREQTRGQRWGPRDEDRGAGAEAAASLACGFLAALNRFSEELVRFNSGWLDPSPSLTQFESVPTLFYLGLDLVLF